jgi:hypothetical protein
VAATRREGGGERGGRPTRISTSVTVLPESEARETGSLTKMPGTSHLPALWRPGSGVGNALAELTLL